MDVTNKAVPVTDLKAQLSECLRQVKQGESWTVTENGRPIAVLLPPRPVQEDLANLAAAGAVRLAKRPLPPEFWDLPQPEDPDDAVRKAVLEEREKGR